MAYTECAVLVFPTTVGMNRNPKKYGKQRTRVPHDRGDEPPV